MSVIGAEILCYNIISVSLTTNKVNGRKVIDVFEKLKNDENKRVND